MKRGIDLTKTVVYGIIITTLKRFYKWMEKMDVDSMTLRILSRSGFYNDDGDDQEYFWTEMHYYKNHCRENEVCLEELDATYQDNSDKLYNSNHIGELIWETEFFECWEYWHRLGSL